MKQIALVLLLVFTTGCRSVREPSNKIDDRHIRDLAPQIIEVLATDTPWLLDDDGGFAIISFLEGEKFGKEGEVQNTLEQRLGEWQKRYPNKKITTSTSAKGFV